MPGTYDEYSGCSWTSEENCLDRNQRLG